jgi:hypothetical protein
MPENFPMHGGRRRFLAAACGAMALPALVRRAGAGSAPIRFGLTPVFLTNDLELLNSLQRYLSSATGHEVELVRRRTYQEVTALLISRQLDAESLGFRGKLLSGARVRSRALRRFFRLAKTSTSPRSWRWERRSASRSCASDATPPGSFRRSARPPAGRTEARYSSSVPSCERWRTDTCRLSSA